MELYHNVRNMPRLKSILKSGFIHMDTSIKQPCVYMTRNFHYLSNRGIRMVFDYERLKHHYRVKPFCYRGWSILNNQKFIPNGDEMEERVLRDVDVVKTCIRIDIDSNKFKMIDLTHPLINHTISFNRNPRWLDKRWI